MTPPAVATVFLFFEIKRGRKKWSVRLYTHTYIYMCVYLYTYIYMCYSYVHTYMCVYIYVYVFSRKQLCVSILKKKKDLILKKTCTIMAKVVLTFV